MEEPEVAVRAREGKFLLTDLSLKGSHVFLVTNLVSLKVPLVRILGVTELARIARILRFLRPLEVISHKLNIVFLLSVMFSNLVSPQIFHCPEGFKTEITVTPVRPQMSFQGAGQERTLAHMADQSLDRPAPVIFVYVRVAEIFREKSRDLRAEVAFKDQI